MTAPQPAVRRGELWLVRLDKVRPAVVLSRDPLGALLKTVIVAPVTSRVRGLSTEVPITAHDGAQPPSVANLDDLQRIERSRFLRRVGKCHGNTMSAICAAIRTATGCD